MTIISKDFSNFESPYVRVALDRNKQEGEEEKPMSNPVGFSTAAGVVHCSSGIGDNVVVPDVFGSSGDKEGTELR